MGNTLWIFIVTYVTSCPIKTIDTSTTVIWTCVIIIVVASATIFTWTRIAWSFDKDLIFLIFVLFTAIRRALVSDTKLILFKGLKPE